MSRSLPLATLIDENAPVWEAVWARGLHDKVFLCLCDGPDGSVLARYEVGTGRYERVWPNWSLKARKHWGGGNLRWLAGDRLLVADGDEKTLYEGSLHEAKPARQVSLSGPWAFDEGRNYLFTAATTEDGEAAILREGPIDEAMAPRVIGTWRDERIWDVVWDARREDRLLVFTHPTRTRPWHATHVWLGVRRETSWHWQGLETPEPGACLSPHWGRDGLLMAVEVKGTLTLGCFDEQGKWQAYRPNLPGHALGERSRERGRSFLAEMADGRLLSVMSAPTRQVLCVWENQAWRPCSEADDWTHIPWLAPHPGGEAWALIAAHAEHPPKILTITKNPKESVAGCVRKSTRYFSEPPTLVTLPNGAHARCYPPAPGTTKPGERPAAVVLIHNGPEKDVPAGWQTKAKSYASWGLATVYVNYAGALRYERAQLTRLQGGWGEVEVEDILSLTRLLHEAEQVDADRLLLMGGGSATLSVFQTLVAAPAHFRAAVAVFPWADVASQLSRLSPDEAAYLTNLLAPSCRDVTALVQRWHQSLRTEMLIIDGEGNPAEGRYALHDALQKRQVPCQIQCLPGERASLERMSNKRLYQMTLQRFFHQTLS